MSGSVFDEVGTQLEAKNEIDRPDNAILSAAALPEP
jgi:hypothetical protein